MTLDSIVKNIKGISSVVGALMVIVGSWWTVTEKMENSLRMAISEQTVLMHEMYVDDLRKRIMVQDSQIQWYIKTSGDAPEWLEFSKKLTEDQLEDAKQWKR